MNVPGSRLLSLLAVLFLPSGGSARADGLDYWTWRNPLPQGTPLYSCAYGRGTQVAVGDRGTVLTSTNPASWSLQTLTNEPQLLSVTFGNDRFVAVGVGIWSSADGFTWAKAHCAILRSVAYGDGRFVAAGRSGSILTSTDAVVWSSSYSGTSRQLNGVAYGGGVFVAVGDSGVLLYSLDGVTWSPISGFADGLDVVTYAEGTWLALGGSSTGSPVALVSNDGASWQKLTRNGDAHPNGLCYGQGKFIMTGSSGLFNSTDGTNWLPAYSEPSTPLYGVTQTADGFLAVGDSGVIITSPDALTWVRKTVGTLEALLQIAYGNGRYLVAGSHGVVLTSANGLDWIQHNAGPTLDLVGLAFGGGRFLACGSDAGVPGLWVTTNGTTWLPKPSPTTNGISGIEYADHRFLAFGGVNFIGTGFIFVSQDGDQWEAAAVEPADEIQSVAFGDARFVAVGRSGTVLLSLDHGATWTRQNSGASNDLTAVAYGRGRFITLDRYGNLFTSADGVMWKPQTLGFAVTVPRLIFANDRFAGVEWLGHILTSTDGLSWDLKPTPARALRSLLFNENRYVAVGDWGTVLQSHYAGPPRLLSPQFSTEGFSFSVLGEPGRIYQVQAAEGFAPATWSVLLQYEHPQTNFLFLDRTSNSLRQFYRVVADLTP